MSFRERLSGNEAIAYAMRQINPDVFAAFPITPSTEIPQYFAQYVANGQVDTEYVTVESEHSSMSTCVGAAAAGARAVTATSSCGLAFMYEMLYVAASARLPITLACVNRTLTGPININNDTPTRWAHVIPAGFRFTPRTIRRPTTTTYRPCASPRPRMCACPS